MKAFSFLILFLLCAATLDAQTQAPAEAEKLYAEGMELKKQQKYAEAVTKFTQAIAIYPWHFDYWHERGYVRIDLGQYHEAIADFSYMLFFSPTHLRARLERAYALNQIGNSEDALKEYKIAAEQHPTDYQAQYEYGYILIDFEDFAKGAEYMKKAAALKPDSGDPLYELGYAYLKSQEFQKALDAFVASRDKLGDSTPKEYYLHVADCQAIVGKKAEACENYRKAEELGVKNAAATRASFCK